MVAVLGCNLLGNLADKDHHGGLMTARILVAFITAGAAVFYRGFAEVVGRAARTPPDYEGGRPWQGFIG
jgi:hypothetical protein